MKRLIILLFFISLNLFCRAKQNYIDSCVLDYSTPSWLESCYIKISGDSGFVKFDRLSRPGERVPLGKDTCALILKGLEDIFLEKRYPIIESKTRTDTIVYGHYPFFEMTIYYKNKKFNELEYVAPRSEHYIHHFSDRFTEFWNIIEKICNDCYARQSTIKREEYRRERELRRQHNDSRNSLYPLSHP